MKNIKKIVSIFLCISFFVCLMPLYAAEAAIKVEPIDSEEYEKLMAFGIIKEEDALENEVYLSRGMMIRLVLRAGGFDEVIDPKTPNVFDDLSEGNKFYDEAITAYSVGLISGGRVRTNEKAKSAEVAKLLTGILGYGKICESNGGYPTGYTSVATKLGIMPAETSNGVLMTDFIKVLAKTLDEEVMQLEVIQPNSGHSHYDKIKDETLLSHILGIVRYEGILEEDFYTSIYSKKTSSDNEIMVGGTLYTADGIDTKGLLGARVELYYNIETEKAVYLSALKGRNEIITVDSTEMLDVAANGRSFTYIKEGKKKEEVVFGRDTLFVYNFEQTTPSKEKLSFERKLGTGENAEIISLPGTVTLIDNDNDNNYEVVRVVAYSTINIDKISERSFTVSDKKGNSVILDETDDKLIINIVKDGKTVDFSALEAGDSILYASSSGNYINYYEVLVSSVRVTGKITEISEEDVKIDSDVYKIYKEVYDTIKLGTFATFYINFRGEICGYSEDVDMVFGYLKEVYFPTSGRSIPQFIIFTENNRWVELNASKKIKINGVRRTYDEIKDGFDKGIYNDGVLIMYLVNEDGEVKEVEFAQNVENQWSSQDYELIDSNTFRVINLENSQFRYGPQSFDDNFIMDSKCKIFFVPKTNVDETEEYYIGTASGLVSDLYYKNIKAYNINRAGVAQAVVIKSGEKSPADDKSNMLVVAGRAWVVDKNGDACEALSVFFGDEEVKIPVSDSSVIEEVGGINTGDVIQIAVDKIKGKITQIKKRYDSAEGFEQKSVKDVVYANPSFFSGKICYSNAQVGTIILDYGDKTGVLAAKNCKVTIYNVENNEVENGTLADLESGKYCLIRASYLSAAECIVFE